MLAADAAAAGVLEALLAAAAAHKSAAAVCAAASCMLTLCLAAPELRERLGKLPGAAIVECKLQFGRQASATVEALVLLACDEPATPCYGHV